MWQLTDHRYDGNICIKSCAMHFILRDEISVVDYDMKCCWQENWDEILLAIVHIVEKSRAARLGVISLIFDNCL